jgi:hypothetical protein
LGVLKIPFRVFTSMDDGGFWISFAGGETKTTVASLVDDRCDSFTVGNLAESVAGFDGRFTRCELDLVFRRWQGASI